MDDNSPSSDNTSSTTHVSFRLNEDRESAGGSTRTLSSSDSADYDAGGCEHLIDLLGTPDAKAKYSTKYRALIAWSANAHGPTRATEQRPAKRRKIQVPECHSCGAALHRPFVCLFCKFGGCWKDGHVLAHMREQNHGICVDVTSGDVFCLACDDFVHNSTFENIYASTVLGIEEKNTRFQETKHKLRRTNFKAWVPNASETDTINRSETISCQGRRGLLNLGSTCYLNVILQSFFHNPLMRNHFLSDKHPQKLCKNTNCLCCEMDKLFSDLYSGTAPYGPVSFLHAMWKTSSEISGYQQQDAHEFFIAVLNQIHASSRGSTSISCVCVVHSTFAGQLQSDVQCSKCQNVTTQVDLVLDISLDLGKVGEEHTLGSCLRRFTQAESLESTCSNCKDASKQATKRLSIRKLPPVLCFTFKRFKHDATATKIDAHVRFPATLNMAPYTSLARADPERLGPPALYEYELFAVINHEGQVNTGHYTNYARFEDEWYRFDDDKVTSATLRECLDSRAYMCLYVKKHLDYKPHQTPSYILTQQQAAERDRLKAEASSREKEKELAALAGI